jgi:hypothetical protein
MRVPATESNGASGRGKRLAMRATYCLQRAGATRSTGRRGRLRTYKAVVEGTCQ